MENTEKKGFKFEDIQEVHINLQFNGKLYHFLPRKSEDQEELKEMRLSLIKALSDTHMVYPISIDELIEKIEFNKTEE